MKQILIVIVAFISFSVQAQQNVFLDPAFWKNNPDLATVEAEIDKGNDPAASNRMGFDAVVYAINAQVQTAVIKFLLDQKGNDANKLTHDGRTYLFWAANRGNVEIVDYLVSKGAKQNIEDTHGMTPISFAANGGQANTKVYDALIKAGADVKQKSPEGASLLLMAVASDKDLALSNYFISKGLSLQDMDAAGNTAFNYVARTGNIELMKTLVEKGVKYNNNAMIMATQGARGSANPIEVYQYLERLHLAPAAVNSNGENALHALARKPNQDAIIQYFLSKGANVNQPDKEGNTPCMNAASGNKDTATVALFLSHAKNINQVNKNGITALAMAVRSNSPEIVQFLINKGADVNGYDAQGNNLAFYLIQSYNAQAQGGGPAQAAARPGANAPATEGNRPAEGQGRGGGQRADGFESKMKILQAAGFNLSAPQKDGNTLYHLAVAKNDIALLKKIEPLQIDVNAKNKEGLTPLQKAAMVAKDDSLLKYFLSIGAKKELTTEFKETAYDLAKENEFLIKNNVPVDFLK